MTGTLASVFLFLLSIPYSILIRSRNLCYDSGLLPVRRVSVPVVSVGNITVGGTGKTPLVAYLTERAIDRGLRPAVVARGYKGKLHGTEWFNDEGVLLKKRFPSLAVVQSPDRVAAARRAIEEMGADLVVLDDAFQHRRIARNVNVLTVDARMPFGNGRVLPAGILREPVSGIRRADAIVMTRSGGLTEEEVRKVGGRLSRLSGGKPVFATDHVPERVRTVGGGADMAVDAIAGKRLFLLSGIAVPEAFRRTVESAGGTICGERIFGDHHDYIESDVTAVAAEARKAGADAVVTTEKDGVKLDGFERAREFLVLEIAIRFRAGEDRFTQLVFG